VCKPIFVDRDNLDSKNFVMNEIKKRAEDLDYPQVAIFPEGTLTNSRALMTFKPGAFGSGSAVQPIVLRFSGWNTYSWTFGQKPTNLGLLTFLTMCQPIINVEMEYLPVYHPSEEEKKDAMMFANNVRQLMAQELNIPISDWTRENGYILDRALKHKMNPIVADFNYYTVSKASNMTFKEMTKVSSSYMDHIITIYGTSIFTNFRFWMVFMKSNAMRKK